MIDQVFVAMGILLVFFLSLFITRAHEFLHRILGWKVGMLELLLGAMALSWLVFGLLAYTY